MSQDSSDAGTSPPAPPGSSVPESGAGNNNDKDSPVAPSPDSTLPSPPPPSDNSNKQPSSPSSDKKSPEAPPPPEAPTQENKSPPLTPPSTSEAPPVPQTPKQQTPDQPPQTQSSPQQQSQPAPDSHSKKSPPSTSSSSSSSESSSADSSPSSSSSSTTTTTTFPSSSSDSNAGSNSSDDSIEASPSPPSPSSSPGTPSSSSSSNSTSSSSSSSSPSSSTSSAAANGFSTPSSSSSPKALGPPTPTTYSTPNPNSNDGSSGSGSSNNNTQSNVSSSSSHTNPPSNQSAVAVTVVVSVLVVVFIVMLFYLRGRKKKQQDSNTAGSDMHPPANYTMILDTQAVESPGNNAVHGQPCTTVNSPQRGPDSGIMAGPKTYFTYEELIEMTDGFSSQNVIGKGGFGCVYKGRMPDGRDVAVKQLKTGGGQGDREFRAEVEIISRVHHKHLVSLVGYSTSENQRLLIYEFVPNKTLEHHLHGKDLPVLEWTKRIKIALGAAKGLAYLHEDCHPKIIHRDIKSANILLEDNFEAKVADFGLARLNDATQSQTHVSTRVMGTFGYLAPEYASSGKLTDRSDVYSFGVVLLELITGRKPVDSTRPLGDESLVEWARPLLLQALETGDYGELIDSRLENRYEEREIVRMIEAAAACVRHSFSKRPHMALVVRSLDFEGYPDLSNGVKYGDSTAYDSGKYSEEIMQFRQMTFSSTENSSELSNSRGVSGGGQSSWNSQYSSGDYTSGKLETPALRPDSGEYRGVSRNHKTTARFS